METASGRSSSLLPSPLLQDPSSYDVPKIPDAVLNVKEPTTSLNMHEGGPDGKDTGVAVPESSFFDLHPPTPSASLVKVEDLAKQLFSAEHLHFILSDHGLFYRFSTFLNRFRPYLIPTLVRYLEMRKAMKAVEYANAVARSIRWPSHTDYCKFSKVQAASVDIRFEDYAQRELLLLCSEALPAFTTSNLVDVVGDLVAKDITGQVVPALQNLVGNLAEVFCLTDPSVNDNPIIYASEEFHKTTQYGTSYAINRNCRFLQGPGTDKISTKRLADAIARGEESNELLLNYRRDGTPFMNLLMCSPLYDDQGIVRYFIGAQVDVTGLVEEGRGVESFARYLQKDKPEEGRREDEQGPPHYTPQRKSAYLERKSKESLDRLHELSTMFSLDESDVVNRSSRGGGDSDTSSVHSMVPTSVKNRGQGKRLIGSLDGGLSVLNLPVNNLGTLPGVYKHYLLVRPHPSLQIIFVSPSLRLPGLMRTHLFSKLGGPPQTMSALEEALRDGAGVTAKVLWLPKNVQSERVRGPQEVKPRWIRCTPLLGSDDRVGVWMIVLVPVDGNSAIGSGYSGANSESADESSKNGRRYGTGIQAVSRAGSVKAKSDGGYGGLREGRVWKGKGADGEDPYTQYLRSSSSIGDSSEDP